MKLAAWTPAALGAAPVALWLLGVFPMDAARVCAGLALVATFFVDDVRAPRWFERFSLLLLVAVPVAMAAHLIVRLKAGLHGVDFAIFSQVAHSIGTTGEPTTTLLLDQPINFLSHHFAPVLYVPGALAVIGVPAPVAVIVVSCASLLFGLFALRRFGIVLGLEESAATAVALAVALSVSIRPEMLWGVHDEVFALGLLGWSMVWLQEGKLVRSLVLVLMCAVAKESFFLLPPFWLLLVRLTRGSAPWPVAISSLAWPLLGVLYVWAQPWLSGREFDHLNKFDWAFMKEHPLLLDRALFVAIPIVSLGFLPVLGSRAIRWCLLAVPFVGLCVVSSDPEMFRPTGYHAIIPAFVIAFAAAAALQGAPRLLSAKGRIWVLVALQLAVGATSLWLPIQRVPSPAWYPSAELVALIGSHTVAADPAAAVALLPAPNVSRLWSIRAEAPPDFVVAKPDGWEPVPQWVSDQYVETRLEPGWRVFRRN